MLNKDTISIQLVREALLQSCATTGAMHEVLQKVGIDPALLDAPQARVPAIAYARMWRLLARRLDDEFFGMDPRKLRAGSLEFMCRSAMAQRHINSRLPARSLRGSMPKNSSSSRRASSRHMRA